jgi:hypothetical protein
MMSLPREIWDIIIRLACVDGGPSACALRATCRFLREAVEPQRFRIVYVSGLDHIQALQRWLEETPASTRHVEHLYISYSCLSETPAVTGFEMAAILRKERCVCPAGPPPCFPN